MQYSPKELDENLNVPRVSAWREFVVLLGGLLGILVGIYIALGFAVDVVVTRMPETTETALGEFFTSSYADEHRSPAEHYLQGIVNGLSGTQDGTAPPYRVQIVQNEAVNAMALPGNRIVVLSGLLDEVESENEIAFVLAHEIGHFTNRDHLKGLGRTLVLVAISSAVLGTDSDATQFLMNSLTKVEMKFSQKQESAADRTALELLNARYGHVGGSMEFFERMGRKDTRGRLTYFFATHPYPPDRVNAIAELIKERGYTAGGKLPLPASVQSASEDDSTPTDN